MNSPQKQFTSASFHVTVNTIPSSSIFFYSVFIDQIPENLVILTIALLGGNPVQCHCEGLFLSSCTAGAGVALILLQPRS